MCLGLLWLSLGSLKTARLASASSERLRWFVGPNLMSDGNERRAIAPLQIASDVRHNFAEEAGGVGAWDWDVKTDRTWWSDVLYTLLGDRPDGALRSFDDFMAFVNPDDRVGMIAEIQAAVIEKRGFEVEFRIVRSDGLERWLIARGKPLFDTSGEVTHMMGVNLDITDRKLAEQALTELNATLEARVEVQSAERERLWSLSEDLMLLAAYDGQVLRANPAATSLFGDRPHTLSRIIHPDHMGKVKDALQLIQNGGRASRMLTQVIAGDGAIRCIAWSFAPYPAGDRFAAVGRDVTDALAAQDRIREAELRLTQVQRMETLGELASGVAHDFNNLLVPIFGVLDMLERRPQGDDDFDALIRGASKAAGNARDLVRRLLAFSQRQNVETEPVEIDALVSGMTDLLRHTLPPAIDMTLAVDPGLPRIRVNATQLELALLNLAINACDAMPDGGQLTIGATTSGAPSGFVLVEVHDTGHGMTPETLKRATEAFYTTKGPGKGTGLGLFMTRRLVEQSGGDLNVKSALGTGTTISLLLPDAAHIRAGSIVQKASLGLGATSPDADSGD